MMPYKNKKQDGSFCHLGACGGLLGTGLLNQQVCLEGCGQGHFCWLQAGSLEPVGAHLLKTEVFMLEMKLNSVQARDGLMYTKVEDSTVTPAGKPNKTRVIWGR